MASVLFVAIFLVTLSTISNVQGQGNIRDYGSPYYELQPKPYSFSYTAPLDDGVGQSSRTESSDGTGRVQGSYTLNNDEGHYRVVEYIADEDGFRASIRTNEPGTESKNPADVTIESEAVPYVVQPYTYASGIRRPVPVAPIVQPAVVPADVLQPAVVPANVLQPLVRRRPVYRRPVLYRSNRV